MFSEKRKNAERSKQAVREFADLIQGWEVRILLGYRPYFDFVISEFNEQWEIKPAKRLLNIWPELGGKSVPLVKDGWSLETGMALDGWPTAEEMADFFHRYLIMLPYLISQGQGIW